jgi:hypothetical protein
MRKWHTRPSRQYRLWCNLLMPGHAERYAQDARGFISQRSLTLGANATSSITTPITSRTRYQHDARANSVPSACPAATGCTTNETASNKSRGYPSAPYNAPGCAPSRPNRPSPATCAATGPAFKFDGTFQIIRYLKLSRKPLTVQTSLSTQALASPWDTTV